MSKTRKQYTPTAAPAIALNADGGIPRTQARPPSAPAVRNAKSDLGTHTAGVVNSRCHGDQLLIRIPDGQIIVVSVLGMYRDGAKLGVRANPGIEVVRREAAPLDWLEEAANTGRRRTPKESDDGGTE
jgi:sRNA-binding carbon storage regulator CsrA